MREETCPRCGRSSPERKARWLKVIEAWENSPSDDPDRDSEDLALMCMGQADEEQRALREEIERLDTGAGGMAVMRESYLARAVDRLQLHRAAQDAYTVTDVQAEIISTEAAIAVIKASRLPLPVVAPGAFSSEAHARAEAARRAGDDEDDED